MPGTLSQGEKVGKRGAGRIWHRLKPGLDFRPATGQPGERWRASNSGLAIFRQRRTVALMDTENAAALLGIIVTVVVWALFMGGIGSLCGSRKDNAHAGFYFGFLLGPIGWIIAALLDYPLKCPACKSGFPKGASVCRSCGFTPNKPNELPRTSSSSSADSEKKKCPFCAELILREAIKCRFCGSDLTAQSSSALPPVTSPEELVYVKTTCPGCGVKIEHLPFNGWADCPECRQRLDLSKVD
jgi:hypothetical protein